MAYTILGAKGIEVEKISYLCMRTWTKINYITLYSS